MHLDFSVPNIWYRAELLYSDKSLSGVTLPGLPLLIAGSNGRVALGGKWVCDRGGVPNREIPRHDCTGPTLKRFPTKHGLPRWGPAKNGKITTNKETIAALRDHECPNLNCYPRLMKKYVAVEAKPIVSTRRMSSSASCASRALARGGIRALRHRPAGRNDPRSVARRPLLRLRHQTGRGVLRHLKRPAAPECASRTPCSAAPSPPAEAFSGLTSGPTFVTLRPWKRTLSANAPEAQKQFPISSVQ
jgi:Penicillin amidase